MPPIDELERQLDNFDSAKRKEALSALYESVKEGKITLPAAGKAVNLHCHTFFSYNTYGYSPSKFAWLAKKAGLAVAGVVDFDVLDALEEFHEATRMLNLKACAGLETRVYVPQFSTRVINSPGEPGISYHMGVGFPTARLTGEHARFLQSLKETAQQRNRGLIDRVNKYLSPVELDYKNDVLPLTPAGNATERHICLAYARKARKIFGDGKKLAEYWTEKLGTDAGLLGLPEGRDLLNTIRAKTMKRGGVGYVQPDKGSFPPIDKTNDFLLAAGALPTWTWLDGTSDGEQAIDELLDTAVSEGCVALNVIPDRNYTAGKTDQKLNNLYKIVEAADRRNLVLIEGTEMNSPGQKFVDDFGTAELSPLAPIFLKGAHIAYAHSVLRQKCGLGYTGDWAKKNFKSVSEKNDFFEKMGRQLEPESEDKLRGVNEKTTPGEILKKVSD